MKKSHKHIRRLITSTLAAKVFSLVFVFLFFSNAFLPEYIDYCNEELIELTEENEKETEKNETCETDDYIHERFHYWFPEPLQILKRNKHYYTQYVLFDDILTPPPKNAACFHT